MTKSKPKSAKPKSKSTRKKKSKSTKSSSASRKSGKISASKIGASANQGGASSSKGKSLSGASFQETSNVKGRPMLCKQMAKVAATKGAIVLKSFKDLKTRGYEVHILGANVGDNVGLKKAKSTKDPKKKMVCKLIELKHCTPRYKITMELYSLKIMRFIGKKPMMECFPKVYDIFLTEKTYFIFMSECSGRSLYDLVVGRDDLAPGRVRKWVRTLTEAVKELQKYGIAHRFIKLKHLMVEANDHLKLVGWSKSVFFYDSKKKKALYQHKEHRARKNNFLPPEAFHRLYDPSKADVWAVGVILISLTTRKYPFHVRAKTKFTTQWRDFVKVHPLNPIVRSLANKVFVLDTKKRIHARDMLTHDYFTVDEKKLINKSVRGKPLTKTSTSTSASTSSAVKSAFKSAAYASHSKSSASGASAIKSAKPKSAHSHSAANKSTKSKAKSSHLSTSGASKSGYSSGSLLPSSKKSRTSKISKSSIGASAAGLSTAKASKTLSKSSASGKSLASSKSSQKKSSHKSKDGSTALLLEGIKTALHHSGPSSKPKSKKKPKLKSGKSKAEGKSTKSAKSAPGKSASKAESASAEKSTTKTGKEKTATKASISEKEGGKNEKFKAKESTKEGGKDSKEEGKEEERVEKEGNKEEGGKEEAGKEEGVEGKNNLDGVSKQELSAEADDAKAEADQAAEEATEPEMGEVAKENAAGEGQAGAEGAASADAEGVADVEEMKAPEEAKDQGTPEEMEAVEGQQQVVEEGAASQAAIEIAADGVAAGTEGGEANVDAAGPDAPPVDGADAAAAGAEGGEGSPPAGAPPEEGAPPPA